jgi:hypothetical protein
MVWMCAGVCAAGAQCAPGDSQLDRAYRAHDWNEVARQAPALERRGGDDDFEFGMALGHLRRWDEARAALLEGRRACPKQARFNVELAGIDFQQRKYPEAAAWLRRGLRRDPNNTYALDFSGTTYFLMGNLPAALKCWNRVEKPYVEELRFSPTLRVQRLIADRAIAFAPAQVLTLSEYEATGARLDGLGIFPVYSIGLNAQPDGKFVAELRAVERDGFGAGRWTALLAVFGGAPYETIYPSYYNWGGTATNVESLLRWDAEKRRAWVEISAPLRKLPQWRWRVATDERDEHWVVRRSFSGTAPELGAVRVSREQLAGSITGLQTGRTTWSAGGGISHRAFSGITLGSALTPLLVRGGWQVKVVSAIDHRVFDLPERRLWIAGGGTSELARLWSAPTRLYEKLEGSERMQWYPQATGDAWKLEQRMRAGKVFGSAPFDELWMLGVERDNELWLRGLIGTRDGHKGSSPLGDSFFLANHSLYRRIYDNGLFGVKAGPLLDVGHMGAPTSGLAPREWLVSTGVEAKVTVLGTGVVATYGRDLRAGTNAFFATVAKRF